MYRIIIPFFVIVFLPTQMTADIIYVPGNYPTIQAGINAAGAGDMVLVAPGTYYEEITLAAGVIVMGAGEGQSIIDGGGNAGDVVYASGNNINETTKFLGFTVTGAHSGGSMPGGAGIFCNSGASPELSNNRVEGNDFGIVTWNQANAHIHNNVAVDNTYTGISLSTDASVVNNTIHGNNIGIYDSGGYQPIVMNNIVTGNTTYGIGCVNAGVPTDITYNDVWNNGQNYHNCSSGQGCISADPLYVDEPNGDYHLQAGSPCIDAGNPSSLYNDPDDTRNDMGAYGGPGATADFPLVMLTVPGQNKLNVIDTTSISAMFNMDMDTSTLHGNSVVVTGHLTGLHSTSITYDSTARMVNADPVENFRCGDVVSVVLSKGIRSIGGDSLRGFIWQFTCRVDSGSGMFSLTTNYPVGPDPYSVVSSDFNADGDFDLVTANYGASNVIVFLGNGDGTFGSQGTYGVGYHPVALVTCDANGDGHPDVISANEGTDNISVLLGNGDGTFQMAVHYPAGSQPSSICCGDFNIDGHIDLATANAASNNVSVLLGVGDGSFGSPTNFMVGTNPHSLTSVDFDNDGFLDLSVANSGSNNISILLGEGDGNFGVASNYPAGSAPFSLYAADVNEDGNLDLAIVNQGANNISVCLGNGDGTFGSMTNHSAGLSPCAVIACDVDGDGHLDLSTANTASHNIAVLLGNGNGTFAAANFYPTNNSPYSLATSDFDNDQDLDFATCDLGSSTLSILLNESSLLIAATIPGQNQLNVSKATDVNATFTIEVNSTTINDETFLVYGAQSGLHQCMVSYDSATTTATLNPTADFTDGEVITACLTKDIQALIGVYFEGYLWNFVTEVTTPSNGSFSNSLSFPVGNEPRGMYAGDFDGDGDLDIASTSNPSSIAVLLGNGDGTFAAPVATSVQSDPIALFGADLDDDGDIDLVSGHNEPGTSHLVVLKNDGYGGFSVFATYAPAILGQDVTGGDLDSDGDVDIVMTDGWGGTDNVKIMFNAGSGNLVGPFTYSAGTWARGVVVKDFDNDGDFDLSTVNAGDNNISVLYNDGNGNFDGPANFTVGNNPTSQYANDLNGDGYVDIATANYGGGDVAVIINNGNGTFGSPVAYQTGSQTRYIHGGDLNGDGDIDLTVSVNGADTVAVLLNDGNGTFTNLSTYQVGDGPWGIQSADYDGDGDLDIACGNYSSNTVTVIYNTGTSVEEKPTTGIVSYFRIFPNPCRDLLSIGFRIEKQTTLDEPAYLKIFDVTGRLVHEFSFCSNGPFITGKIKWDGTDSMNRKIPNGVYFCQLSIGDKSFTEQFIMVR